MEHPDSLDWIGCRQVVIDQPIEKCLQDLQRAIDRGLRDGIYSLEFDVLHHRGRNARKPCVLAELPLPKSQTWLNERLVRPMMFLRELTILLESRTERKFWQGPRRP